METLYLVRHGQASFGAADYDNLSQLGHQQAVRLGEYFKSKNLQFDGALVGTLRRHAQTYAGICQGASVNLQALQWPGLNEYDSDAVIKTVHFEPLSTQPQGMPSYPDFAFMPKRHMLVTYNTLPHLEDFPDWVTYA